VNIHLATSPKKLVCEQLFYLREAVYFWLVGGIIGKLFLDGEFG
jgi:hypothetical protein